MWRALLVFLALGFGVWMGKGEKGITSLDSVGSFSLKEHKPFVVVLYAYNNASWCEKSLRSIFEQDYNNYRVVIVDDASIDGTEKVSKEFIVSNNQDHKVLFIRNDRHLGALGSLKRVLNHCLDREVLLFFHAQDWLISPNVLSRMNLSYQNPDVWTVTTRALDYPSYQMNEEGIVSAYVNVLKSLEEKKLHNTPFEIYLKDLKKTLRSSSRKQVQTLQEPLQFVNRASARSLES